MHTGGVKHPSHDRALKQLALDSLVAIDDLEKIYEIELTKLGVGARISVFIHVCALRHVREIVRQRGHGPQLGRAPSKVRNAPPDPLIQTPHFVNSSLGSPLIIQGQ
jgi:hypothetical protein